MRHPPSHLFIYPFFIGLLLFGLSSIAMAVGQPQKEIETIIRQTNVDVLLNFSREKEKAYQTNKAEAINVAKDKGWIIRKDHDKGMMELQGITKSGKPLYYITHNSIAAQSTSTDEVWSGASAGLDLDGSGMIAGEWDAGGVRLTHQEFNNSGFPRVIQQDSPFSTHYHSTHVAGTIMAGGVQANAKGMAYDAILHAYDWNSDENEMAVAAAAGLLVSNHSYGYGAGWVWNGFSWVWYGDDTISPDEDFQFGFYSSYTRDIDVVAVNAPYYLIVKSAGNDRGDGSGEPGHPQDGGADGFDCIGYKGNAKNILTVGAVLDIPGGYSGPGSVQMTTFSSWGPTDDGRIKPDICGNGYQLYSTYDNSDSAYNSISGTSMSSPNVTGSLLLLQEHYNELHGGFMTAATLKALALHSADEAGPDDGPDYMFGWGMLNTETAAVVISNRDVSTFIKEETYVPGSLYSLDVTATGTEPLIVTVVWTDPPGTPVVDQLDPTDIMLVNDLDTTVSDGTTTWYPYMLNGQDPSAAATTGNNNVDNVEKIVISTPVVGDYTIAISHEGTISGGSQDFSLIVSGITTIQRYDLDVTVAGSGSGSVSATGISCPGDCSESFEVDTVVNLTATPTTESRFDGWSGDADCSDGQVTMSAARSCTATFDTAFYLPMFIPAIISGGK